MHGQHHPDLGHEPARSRQIAVVHSPNIFSRALTRSTAVRPLYIRSNFFVAAATPETAARSTSRGTRTVLPYDFPRCKSSTSGTPSPRASPGSGTSASRARARGRCTPSGVAREVRSPYHNNRLSLPPCTRRSRCRRGPATSVRARSATGPHLDQRRDPFVGEQSWTSSLSAALS